ncbi:ABC transporter permease [Blastococcus haudaquaticus]|uniref:Monosaccharide ABC transporter membrane protein, CUT2 family n=1 Tax=Blastococcus haudaquaticus TaxID=1938745 RepID=A0A286H157_9ACTN|nr:ABC transporter permease [Blastococcus haudaquaticus]SOE01495.1 monosaccharide ABC transporter membrane protein, CUT2 family [Blastococcus haudaquaticus]
MSAVTVTGPSRSPALVALERVQSLLLPALLIGEVIVFALLSSRFLSADNLVNVAVNAADIALIAAGLTVVVLMGGIDVSTGYAVGLISWFLATLMSSGTPGALTLIVALIGGALLGLLNGLLTARLSIPSIVATLGTSALFQTALFALWNRRDVFSGPVLPFLSGSERAAGVPLMLLVVLVVYAALHLVLVGTRVGRSVFAIGSNVEAARLAGIDVRRVRLLGSLVLGLLVGLAACTYLARVGVVQASSGGELSLLAIASVVVGGTSILGGEGSVLRTLGGVVFIALLENGIVLAGVPSLWNGLLVGCVILLAVGVNGAVVLLRRRSGVAE